MPAAKLRPSKSYKKLMNIGRFCGRLIGVDVIVPNYRMNILTFIVIFFFIFYYIFSICTILKFLTEDWAVMLEVICTMGSATTGLVKFISAICYAKKYYKLHIKLVEIYCKYENVDIRYETVLHKTYKRLQKFLYYNGLLYVFIAASIISVPIFMIWYNGKQYLMLHFQIPYLDSGSQYGYWLTFMFHLGCVLIAAFGLYAGDIYLLIFLSHALLFADILTLKIEDLNQVMSGEIGLIQNLSEELNDILQWHQNYFE